jgi:hypothetical protein
LNVTLTLPNVLVIGAQKAGTTSLHYYLGLHPQISMSHPKELDFFIDKSALGEGCQLRDSREIAIANLSEGNWSSGLQWYSEHFDAQAPVRGESSPNYTAPWFLPAAAERIQSTIPDVRLIFVVRDPIERMISQYMHYVASGQESRDIATAFGDPDGMYTTRSLYHAQLEHYLARFPVGHILITAQEDLLRRRRATLREIFEFLEVDPNFWSQNVERLRQQSAAKGQVWRLWDRAHRITGGALDRYVPYGLRWRVSKRLARPSADRRPSVDPELRQTLVARFREDVARLREVASRDFREWSL